MLGREILGNRNLGLDTKGAMTHSKCLVTAEQKAAYAALMPQNAILQAAFIIKKSCVMQVICGVQRLELCQVVLRGSWTLQDLLEVVSRETGIPGHLSVNLGAVCHVRGLHSPRVGRRQHPARAFTHALATQEPGCPRIRVGIIHLR